MTRDYCVHDDNYGVTSALWETYYRYYFQDGRYGKVNGVGDPETTYPEFARERIFQERNIPRFGLDADIQKSFLQVYKYIKMARKTYTCYTLVNPHSAMATRHFKQSGKRTQWLTQMVIEYETVFQFRGRGHAEWCACRIWKRTL